MAGAAVDTVLKHIRRIAGAAARQARTDRQLLEEFVSRGEEAAFAVLVRRHGPMVLGVCQRVLGHQQDAEDAFQATFMVLARKAGAVHWHESIGNWLYGVAYRLSQKLRASNARRCKHLVQTEAEAPAPPARSGSWQEMQGILDEELQRLPEKYRAPLVLCYLEGKTRDEAAQHLGWTLQVIKGRLERGRNLLRRRLTRRGLNLSAALLPLALVKSGAAAPAAPLVTATVTAATETAAGQALTVALSPQVLALTQGALQIMFWTKIKLTTLAVMAIALLSTGAGLVLHQALGGASGSAAAVEQEGQPKRGTGQAKQRPDQPGEKKEREKGKTLKGLLKEINIDKGDLVLTTLRDGEGKQDHTLNLAGKDIKVFSSVERPAQLEQLKPGAKVTLFLNHDEDVTAIMVEVPKARVTIKTVDPAKNSITFKSGEEQPEKTVTVAQDAKIIVEGQRGQLADLKENMTGNATFSLDQKEVVLLQVGRVKAEGEGGREKGAGEQRFLIAELVAVDKNKKTITVVQKRDAGDMKKTLDLDKDVKINLGREEKEPTLDDLKPGSQLALKLADDQKTVVAISLQKGGKEAPGLAVFLKKVNAADNSIIVVIKGEGGQEKEKTFTVPKDAKLVISRKENATLADLKEGQRVLLQFGGDRQTITAIRLLKAEGERE